MKQDDLYIQFFVKNLMDNGIDKVQAHKLATNWDPKVPVDLKKLAEAVKACHKVKKN